ncbi:hypothetical protein [Microbispora sp. NPDC049125]|uniref:hypothetical protein n=1 Tax=Microbispora sp. NPDC049125 TaxID=3154929 RepID=UPI003467E06E
MTGDVRCGGRVVARWPVGAAEHHVLRNQPLHRNLGVIDRLAKAGPALGRPLMDTLEDDDLNNLKELRPLPKPLRDPDDRRQGSFRRWAVLGSNQ